MSDNWKNLKQVQRYNPEKIPVLVLKEKSMREVGTGRTKK